MPLSQLSLTATVAWQKNVPVPGFADVVQGNDSVSADLSGVALATWDQMFAAQYTVAPAGAQVVDLRSFTDVTGAAVTGTRALLVMVTVAGAAADALNVRPAASAPLQWFFGDTAEGVNVPGGGALLFSAGAGAPGAVVDGTHRNLVLTNTGSADLVVKILVVLSDV